IVPSFLTVVQAQQLAQGVALIVKEYTGPSPGHDEAASVPSVLLLANGSYQLEQMLAAGRSLQELKQPYRLVYLQEPGRFRHPRDIFEAEQLVSTKVYEHLFAGP